jgi:hypothetical protein
MNVGRNVKGYKYALRSRRERPAISVNPQVTPFQYHAPCRIDTLTQGVECFGQMLLHLPKGQSSKAASQIPPYAVQCRLWGTADKDGFWHVMDLVVNDSLFTDQCSSTNNHGSAPCSSTSSTIPARAAVVGY